MTLTEQVYAQACMLAGDLEAREQELMFLLSRCAVNSLTARLRSGIRPEDCKADFVAAASLFTLASMTQVSQDAAMDQVKLGDVTLKRRDADTASRCLHHQAEMIIGPYLADTFSFQGV